MAIASALLLSWSWPGGARVADEQATSSSCPTSHITIYDMGTILGCFWLMKLVPTLQTGPASLPEASKLPASMHTIALEHARHPCLVPFGMPHLQR